MNKFIYIYILLSLFYLDSYSQKSPTFSYDPYNAPNTYRSQQNPNYWKHKMPRQGYWQQDVHYSIQANLDVNEDMISGHQNLTYWNNSPDTIKTVYFHLYANSFLPEAYQAQILQSKGKIQQYGTNAVQNLGIQIENLKILRRGKELYPTIEYDHSIVKVNLPDPLAPNDFMLFSLDFRSYFDDGKQLVNPMQVYESHGEKIYNGAAWYPRICSYYGNGEWNKEQYFGEGLNGEYGTYDVELALPNHYICGGTGFLTNQKRLLPTYLKKELSIENFRNKNPEEGITEIIEAREDRIKVWKYHIENVCDFAFITSPIYRLGEVNRGQKKITFLVQEPHVPDWKNTIDSVLSLLDTYEQILGENNFNQLIIGDLPQSSANPSLLTFSGISSYNRQDFAFNLFQLWLSNMVGNKDSKNSFLSDGLSHYLTLWLTEQKNEDQTLSIRDPQINYQKKFLRKFTQREREAFYPWYQSQQEKNKVALFSDSEALFTKDQTIFASSAVFFYQLEYLIGSKKLMKGIVNYISKWKGKQPNKKDFFNEINKAANQDLNWFFEQWFAPNSAPDYSINSFKQREDSEEDWFLELEQKGGLTMPIDFSVTSNDSQVYYFHIPTANFQKETNSTILPAWPQFPPEGFVYKVALKIPGEINNIEIDPSGLLADVNTYNNRWKNKTTLTFERGLKDIPKRDAYEMSWRPNLWYNGYDGVKLGVVWKGHHLNRYHRFTAKAWLASRLPLTKVYYPEFDESLQWKQDWLSLDLKYQSPVEKLLKDTDFIGQFRWLEGLRSLEVGLERRLSNRKKIRFYSKTMYRHDRSDIEYLIHPLEWNKGTINHALHLDYNQISTHSWGPMKLNVGLTSSALFSDYDFNALSIENIAIFPRKKYQLRLRGFLQIASGDNPPPESSLFLAGANPEQMMENPFSRSYGAVLPEVGGYGPTTQPVHFGGGLGVRGFAGYHAPEVDGANGQIHYLYKGTSGFAINMEFEFDRFLGFHRWNFMNKHGLEWHTYFFADAGIIGQQKNGDWIIGKPRADVGTGISLTLNKLFMFENFKPITFRGDFPMYLSEKDIRNQDWYVPKWIVGVGRAF